jgi:large subunit ribosomal protein L21
MYAIVKTGGKQYRVAVGDVLNVEKLDSEPGAEVSLPAVLLVDGSELITDADALATASVTATVVEQTKGPKIRIHKFKHKTGYHKRQGHRQPLTRLEVTDISAKAGAKPAAKTAATKTTKKK